MFGLSAFNISSNLPSSYFVGGMSGDIRPSLFGASYGEVPGSTSIARENPLPTSVRHGISENFSMYEPDGDWRLQDLFGAIDYTAAGGRAPIGGVPGMASTRGGGGLSFASLLGGSASGAADAGADGGAFNLAKSFAMNDPLFGPLSSYREVPGTVSIARENPLPTSQRYGVSYNFSMYEPDGDWRLQDLFSSIDAVAGGSKLPIGGIPGFGSTRGGNIIGLDFAREV